MSCMIGLITNKLRLPITLSLTEAMFSAVCAIRSSKITSIPLSRQFLLCYHPIVLENWTCQLLKMAVLFFNTRNIFFLSLISIFNCVLTSELMPSAFSICINVSMYVCIERNTNVIK